MPIKSTSLIITTYNWHEALDLVLSSVLAQSVLPNEVIIADDGSTESTRNLINHYQKTFPLPLIHSWQKNTGFRLARSRNKAIAKATSDYIIMVDGDMILHPHFMRDHKNVAKKGRFTQGRRTILTQFISQQALMNKQIRFPITSPHVKNKINAISMPVLSPLISTLFSKQTYLGVRGCNMAIWKDDLIAVNGFNEHFVGWGREDSEFVLRLLNYGIKRYDLRFGGIAYHLYHHENKRNNLAENNQLLKKSIEENCHRCTQGLDQHL